MVVSNPKEAEMKDIPDVPNDILKAAADGKLVIFIGAGVSRIIGCPSWKKFAVLQLNDLRNKGAINYYEYKNLESLDARRLLSICRRIYEEKSIKPPGMESLLKAKDELIKKFTIYDDLLAFNVIYVTTNYDGYMEKAAKRRKSILEPASGATSSESTVEKSIPKFTSIHSKDELLISSLTNGSVIHLHGSVKDESNAIVTIVDYMEHYKRDSKPDIFLRELFNAYTVLFVGYGLEEYEILEFMISKSQTAKGELRHYMLYPVFKKETNLLGFQRKYYEDLGIHLIPYPMDENGYEHLAKVISEWGKQIGPISRPQGFIEKVRLIDEVVR